MRDAPAEPARAKELRYAVDEAPPPLLALGLSAQIVALLITGIVLVPIIVLTAGGGERFIEWAVFATLLVSGLATILQARPLGIFGAGYPLYMGTSGVFIAVGTAAVAAGGLPLLATLVAVSSLAQFAFAARLSLFRRLVTPTVGGTVLMLLAVNVFPVTADLLARGGDLPEGSAGPPLVALATFASITLVSLYSRGAMRLWAPLIGIAVGCLAALPFDMLDVSAVVEAPWFGLPGSAWPGLDLSFDGRFFGLLLPFVIVTLIGAIETYGDAIAIQRVCNRGERPADFRVVQRAVNADGLGNLLSGLAGTLPNTTYSTSISIADLTGVGARRVAVCAGLMVMLIAFVPKIPALLRVVPDPVAGAYILIFIVLLFRQGVRLVTTGGFDYEKGLIVCLSFWIGVGFQNGVLFPDFVPAWSKGILDNGMASGGLVAIALTALMALRNRGRGESLRPTMASLARLADILANAASNAGWDRPAAQRLQLAGEEAFLYLMERQEQQQQRRGRIRVAVRPLDDALQLEFLSGPGAGNLEARIEALRGADEARISDAGPRLLAHLARAVRHEQFYELESLTLDVESRPLA